MAQAEDDIPETDLFDAPVPRRSRWILRVLIGMVLAVFVVVAAAWFSRERIAEDLIGDQLEQLGIAATYDIEEVGPARQVLTNIVIGNPARPDLTIERILVDLDYGFRGPAIGLITVERARAFGSYRDGVLSFGALDPLLMRDTGEPPALPDIALRVIDARALVESDFGPIGIKAEGEGQVDDGFSGILAATAPQLDGGGCSARRASLYGTISSRDGKPRFAGPMRAAELFCPEQRFRVKNAALQVEGGSDASFAILGAEARLSTGAASVAGNAVGGVNGTLRANWQERALNGTYSLAARSLGTPQLGAALITAEGTVRGRDGFEQTELTADVEGNGVRLGDGIDGALAEFTSTAGGTFAAPLIAKMRAALRRESRGSRLAAQVNLRQTGKITSLIISQASLTGGGGANLLSLSRFQLSTASGGTPKLSGNIVTGGAGLPRIVGRMERSARGNLIFRMRMAEYSDGGSSVEIPELVLLQGSNGAVGFSGSTIASGPLPGGSMRALVLPISGNYSARGGLSMWRECTEVRFAQLALANLVVERQSLTLCPAAGRPVLRADAGGLRLAAGTPSLDLSGTLADTPIRIASGAVGAAYPGALSARNLDITLGAADSANRFTIAHLDAIIGENIGGRFSDADVRLFAVPIDLTGAAGAWDYTGGVLTLSDSVFTATDRSEAQRFKPLQAQGASLSLADSIVLANARLREPESGREVVRMAIRHDLGSSAGFADLWVDSLRFDKALQPEQLSEYAKGVIANAAGVITGKGRIDWNSEDVTSSGSFSSESFDFAAAFGPVKGASGTVRFTDLLNLTTAPKQILHVASINPGIEVNNGEVLFAVREGSVVSVLGGRWPFMGGTLLLEPVELTLGAPEVRAYVLTIQGLDAAQFIAQMELGNLNATGTFDGTVPLVFDAMGNGSIQGGLLVARPPGGNLSYIGELTYEDMTPMVNFAFDALRSLDYREMRIEMDGSLSGELVTKVRFDGVSQGSDAKRNFLTRQIDDLPIRFNVNIRAPFYQLITSIKAMYDPAFIKDPRELGLISAEGRRVVPAEPVQSPVQPPVQGPESEKMP
ncbi:YdbH domain-containing protein [Allopontixanthobacter sp.]|uniref:YdbH domain-containing protein n=1 Tax=Allopontixanthobacter sp. TaxID=2906452 RepID=UPI002ABCFEB8|nr:YdbH domain-containing protein [Allopontixanthobacter sp.]MDZ4307855.1 YdbH domain-containing protein [Allopontixanthobacter sp.]